MYLLSFTTDAKNGRAIADNGDSRLNGTGSSQDRPKLVKQLSFLIIFDFEFV